jgi:hypothetical protein
MDSVIENEDIKSGYTLSISGMMIRIRKRYISKKSGFKLKDRPAHNKELADPFFVVRISITHFILSKQYP